MTFPQADSAATTIINSLDPTGWRDRAIGSRSSPAVKVALFRALFRGREDVYARRFESRKSGRSGYEPDCTNEWVRGVCQKPKINYFVLRFLAEDVGKKLDIVLDAIERAVISRSTQ